MLGIAQVDIAEVVRLLTHSETSMATETFLASLILIVSGAFAWISCSDRRDGTYPTWLRWIFACPPLTIGGFGLVTLVT
jgi:hypothetical protein